MGCRSAKVKTRYSPEQEDKSSNCIMVSAASLVKINFETVVIRRARCMICEEKRAVEQYCRYFIAGKTRV